jgi:hypothetical protein
MTFLSESWCEAAQSLGCQKIDNVLKYLSTKLGNSEVSTK